MPHNYQGMVLSLKARPELTGSCFPSDGTSMVFALILHHLVWLEYANNERISCGIVVIDINICAILG